MLADFALVDNLYRFRDNRGKKLNYLVDMLLLIETLPVGKEREARRHMGDFCLFIAGIFPESINRGGRRSFSPSLYINEGKKSYRMVSEMGYKTGEGAFFNKLAHKFDSCIHALGLEKEYLFDPFYQYLMKQLGRFLKHRSAISTIAELNFLSHARISS